MAERRQWILVGILVALLVVVTVSQIPTGYSYPIVPRLSTNLPSPDGAKALYLTARELGVAVGRREAPLLDAGPLPPALAILAPEEPLTPGEVSAVLDHVRAGGRLLWVAAPRSPMSDSLHLHMVATEGLRPGTTTYEHVTGVATDHPWAEGVDSVRDFRFGWTGKSVHRKDITPLVIARDTLVLAFVETLGEGRIVAFADREPVENRGIRDSGAAPILLRAAAALAAGDTLVFDEFHHGFRGGSITGTVSGFLAHRPIGRVLGQLALVGLLALLAAAVRLGSPMPPEPEPRRSRMEHVDALARVYEEAGALRRPRLLLVRGLARALGEPPPRTNVEAAAFLERVAGRAAAAAAPARRIREALANDAADIGRVSMDVDEVREALGVRSPEWRERPHGAVHERTMGENRR